MKKAFGLAALNFVGVIAVFAFIELFWCHMDTAAFAQSATRPFFLVFTGILALTTSALTYLTERRKADAEA